MKTRTLAHRISAVALLAIACDQPSAELVKNTSPVAAPAPTSTPAALAAQGGFAYADSTGAELLALDSLPDPSTILGAICGGGLNLPVRYDRRQVRQPNDTGRQVVSNFHNEQGDVFRVMQGSAPADGTCYLSRDSALLANARTATMREPSDCSPAHASRLADAKRRQVIHCWHIAAAPPQLEVLAVQFAVIDSSALASLAVVSDTNVVFKDFPAVYRGPDDDSTWRVDDGGVFSPGDFEILFVAALPSGYVMAITWAGAEGQSCELLLADSAGAFHTLTQGYRYWVPG